MPSTKEVDCYNCGATNPHDYTFCFSCRACPDAPRDTGDRPVAAKAKKKKAKKKS